MQEINKLEVTEPDFPYEEILYLEHPISRKHPRLEMENRAAQFAPFAALTGFGDQIREVQRLTDSFKILDENTLSELNPDTFVQGLYIILLCLFFFYIDC